MQTLQIFFDQSPTYVTFAPPPGLSLFTSSSIHLSIHHTHQLLAHNLIISHYFTTTPWPYLAFVSVPHKNRAVRCQTSAMKTDGRDQFWSTQLRIVTSTDIFQQ